MTQQSTARARVVDLFAGAGGFSTGAVAAGCDVILAANHWPAAVAAHTANHPGTVHWTQDLHQADWSRIPAHDILTASPACQGHSRARGTDKPHHDLARSTAWAVVSCAEHHRPDVVIVENVPEFRAWTLYPAWRQAMNALGYALAEHVIDAADHGVPQHRRRLFVVAARGMFAPRLALPMRPHVPALSIVDWSAGRWSPVDRPGRSAKTLTRWREGRAQHGDRFTIPYYGSTRGGRSLAEPIGTITTRDRHALIDGDVMRMLTVDESRRGMGFPDGYVLPSDPKLALHLLGNAVVPVVAEDVIRAVCAA